MSCPDRVIRPEDMSPDGSLELIRQDDGDIIVLVRCGHGEGAGGESVEFCLSGGHSPWTLVALHDLMLAMYKDHRREPWPAQEEVCKCECWIFGTGYMGNEAHWCYWPADYPDEGSAGPFDSRKEAEAAAFDGHECDAGGS